jgi:hypothetical protein
VESRQPEWRATAATRWERRKLADFPSLLRECPEASEEGATVRFRLAQTQQLKDNGLLRAAGVAYCNPLKAKIHDNSGPVRVRTAQSRSTQSQPQPRQTVHRADRIYPAFFGCDNPWRNASLRAALLAFLAYIRGAPAEQTARDVNGSG